MFLCLQVSGENTSSSSNNSSDSNNTNLMQTEKERDSNTNNKSDGFYRGPALGNTHQHTHLLPPLLGNVPPVHPTPKDEPVTFLSEDERERGERDSRGEREVDRETETSFTAQPLQQTAEPTVAATVMGYDVHTQAWTTATAEATVTGYDVFEPQASSQQKQKQQDKQDSPRGSLGSADFSPIRGKGRVKGSVETV